MNDISLDLARLGCHGSRMRFDRLSRAATRMVLAGALALTMGPTVMAAPNTQDVPDAPAKDRPRPPRTGDDGPPPKKPAKPEARVPGEKGKPQPAKTEPTPAVAVGPVPLPPPKPPAAPSGEPAPKLPRFAALKTDETNMRRGPGQRYPIDWVYKRRDLPVTVEREYDVWRLVRDQEGIQGWVHQVTLSDRRTFVVTGADATIRSDASDTSAGVALLKPGVIGRIRACDQGSKWCQVQVGTFKGYLRRDQFWGLLPNEVVTPS